MDPICEIFFDLVAFQCWWDCLQDEMYWWGAFDMVRRLFQTSVVVLVRIVDSRYDAVYMVLVSFVSFGLLVSHKARLGVANLNDKYKLHIAS